MKTPAELIEKINQVKNGNSNAFTDIYEGSYKYLHTCVIHIVKNEDIAQDMLQDTYVEIFKNISQLKQAEDFLSWASTIANRKCFAYIKKDRDILVDVKTDDEGNESDFFESVSDNESFIPENIFDNKAKIEIIRGIIDDLSDVQRACVIGFYYNNQKQDEIAEQLGIPVNTVKSHLNRAKAKIKESVSDVEKKQGIKLYSFAPFMLLLFGYEAKAYATSAPVMGSQLSGVIATEANTTGVGAGSTAKIAGSVAAKKIAIASIIGLIAVGGIVAAIVFGKGKVNDEQTDTTVTETVATETDTGTSVTETEDKTTVQSDTQVEKTIEEEKNEPELNKLGDLKAAGFDDIGKSYAGVMIVEKDGLFGAADYDLNEIVPCKYESFSSANNKGYFVMGDGSQYYLFDKTGKVIYQTPNTIIATANCFIVAPISGYGEWIADELLDYYDYDGNLIIETSMMEGTAVVHVGSHDDNIVLLRRYSEDVAANHSKMEVGKMYEDGHITWQTEYDSILYWEEHSDNTGDFGWEGHGASSGSYMPRPLLSGISDGYYITYHPFIEWGYMCLYDENSNEVCDFDVCYMKPDGSYSEWNYNEYNDIYGYYYDGAYTYNRGTKMVWICSDRYLLVDVSKQKALADYDYICMAEDDLWLVQNGDKWGYIDPEGNEIAMYDDAGQFYNGYAPIIKDGKAYLIDMDQNIVEELGESDRVSTMGELYCVTNGDKINIFQMN